jgi:molybdenum cofactor cytidylyltransferase
MKFGEIPVAEAVGAVLAHSLKAGDRSLRKGRVLSAEDVAALRAAGRSTVIAARLEPGDVDENTAAGEIAGPLAGPHVSVARPFTGRVNLFAEVAGVLVFDRARVDRLNLVDETLTLATIEPYSVVAPKQMVATVKVIPFAVRERSVAAWLSEAASSGPLIAVTPFSPRRVALIQTRLPGTKESMLDKTVETTRERLAGLGSTLVAERRSEHRPAELAPHIAAAIAEGAELVLVAGASAIVDRRDVIPAAIEAAGGVIEHFGMPVDPGNLMLMGRCGTTPVLGLPGCARSPKVNGFDWVLQRLLAGLPAGPAEIMRMGVGGLLADIPTRPLPRVHGAWPWLQARSKPFWLTDSRFSRFCRLP